MLRRSLRSALAAAVATVALAACAPAMTEAASRAIGTPSDGRLVGGVRFPASGTHFFTWDFPLGVSPNRPWRRYGTDRLVAVLRRVIDAYALAHPFAARVGVADLSRPHGGPFGARYGGLGHASHQNGLDADVVYPRLDFCECAPDLPSDVDLVAAQDLVNRFVAAGAQYVFVGPHLRLRGPRGVVIHLVYHDNHMHVRIYPPARRRTTGATPSPIAARHRALRGAAGVDAAQPPVIPRISGGERAHLLAVAAAGRARGNRADVFAKVGDSITESGSFLQDIGCGDGRLGSHRGLASTVAYFARARFPAFYSSAYCGIANSFTRASQTAVTGWDAGQALARYQHGVAGCLTPFDTPLRCELHLLRPSVALVMYGTNDLERTSVATYRRRLRRIAGTALSAGVIPVLSTIPPRHDGTRYAARVPRFNTAVVAVARSLRVPLWNYWRALRAPGVIDEGIGADGVHPSVFVGEQGGDLTDAGLHYGYNVRNLTALEVLAAVHRAALG